jgi:signal peptidase II
MRLLGIVAVVIFVLDQITKWLVVFRMGLIDRGVIDVWPPYLTFRMAWNTGINFGLLGSESEVTRWALIVVALAITAWVLWWMRKGAQPKIAQVAAGLLVGGALGNVVDRVLYGAVADFLNMSCCGIENPYAFNVADISIFAGAIGLVLFSADPGAEGRRGRKAR